MSESEVQDGAVAAVIRCGVGRGLLSTGWGVDRADLVALMTIAYASIGGGREQNFKRWYKASAYVIAELRKRFAEAGLKAPPLAEDAFWSRVEKPMLASDGTEHIELVRALVTDYGERLAEHVVYRLVNEGNVHLEFTGPTGIGKSSCALALADWITPIPRERLAEYVSFDIGELASKLRGKKAGETVVQDEYIATAGEGARTFQSLFNNLEDTLRASGVNLFVLSPREQEHATMQARLEAIMWNTERKFTLFLVWLENKPHGVVALPWAEASLYAAYKPWKEKNVARSLSGQFKDTSYVARQAVRVFEDARIVKYLTVVANKPKKGDFEAALVLFHPQMMSGAQQDRLVDFMYAVAYGFKQLEPYFEEWWGVEPNDGMREVAARCGKA